jgi:uncharacterized protein
VLVDANILLYAVDEKSPYHQSAAGWLERVLNGSERVALPWQTIGTFLRISTHPRIVANPFSSSEAMAYVNVWLDAGPTWIPPVSTRTLSVLDSLVTRYHVTGNLVPDAQLAALAIEHGLELLSADTDFARFKEVRWRNPLA